MANKTIFQLTPSAALVSTDEVEKQVTGGGQSQKLTLAQMLTFIQNNASALVQTITFGGSIAATSGKFSINQATGSMGFAGNAINCDASGNLFVTSLDVGASNLTISTLGVVLTAGDVEINDTNKGVILKSPNGTRYRIKVSDLGVLSTVAA